MKTAMNKNLNLRQLLPSRLAWRAGILLVISAALTISVFADPRKTLEKAQKAIRAGDFERAEKLYREVLHKDESHIEARLGLSKVLLKQRRLAESFEHAARVRDQDPTSARAHALLGSAILAAGVFPHAVGEFHAALKLDENDSMAIAGLAMIDFYENRTLLCVEKLKRAIYFDANEPDYVFSLGQAAARSEKYAEAADAYERFLLISPKTDAERRARIRGLIDFLRYLGAQSSLYNVSGASRTVIPFESLDNRPIVRVRINGSKELLRFVLDTGSGMSVLSEETAKKLGIKPVAQGGLARAVGGEGRFEIVYGHLGSLELGDVRIENVPVYIRHFFDNHNPVDGYLGIAALSRLVTAVDYGTRRMTLIRQKSKTDLASVVDQPSPQSDNIEMRPGVDVHVRTTSSGFLSGEVMIEGISKPLNFIIDTGATTTVLSEGAASLEEALTFIQPNRMRVFGAAGVTENVKIALLPKVAIGSYTREKVSAAVLNLDSLNETTGFQQNGILGGNFLRHFRVVFDFQRGIVRLEPLEFANAPKDTTPWDATQGTP
ncbi:MAG TPA: aspartyl protease family protein [Pyrinomonadaceae bacterium]|nr:aspartyl protease family protein [Pyrinomonadaceae bacterium]